MTQPTGVFVRLPLSNEQRELMVDAAALGQHDDSHDKALLAIGTPVTGGELEVYHALTVMTIGGPERVPLVRQLDAQAALASAQAEIERLRDNLARTLEIAISRADGTTCTHLVRQAFSLAKSTCMSADDVVQTVLGDLFPTLKGPEA